MEKVIKGLKHCSEIQNCLGCPYCKGDPTCQDDLCKDALELLKEQDAKEKNRLPYSPDSNVQWT